MAEKYSNESPYIYCGNNSINAIDSDGKEKIIALTPIPKNKPLIKAANSFNDEKKVINIWAHGGQHGIHVYDNKSKDEEDITDSKHFKTFLDKNSAVWKNKGKDEQITIVLHACRTGHEEYEQDSFAREISNDLKNTIIIAPYENISVTNNDAKDLGPGKKNKDGEYEEARWIKFENGDLKKTYPNDSKPGSKEFNSESNAFSSFWNKLFELFK